MADTRDSSVSPMTRTPRSASPFTGGQDGTLEPPRDTQVRIASPLRTVQKLNGSLSEPSANGEPVRPSTPSSVKMGSVAAEPKEYPWTTVNGAAGPAPTNDLLENGKPESKSEPIIPFPTSRPASLAPPSRKATNNSEIDQPAGRKSVQFAHHGSEAAPSHSRHQSTDTNEGEGTSRRFLSKIKALAAPISLQGHGRSQSAFAVGNDYTIEEGSASAPISPAWDLSPRDESEADADAEDSGGEGLSRPRKERRKSRRWEGAGSTNTEPTTPRSTRLASFFREPHSPGTTPTSAQPARQPFLLRRVTMGDIPEHQRQGVSEDEGRNRLAKQSAWKRRLHSSRDITNSTSRERGEDSDGHRPSNLRRLTNFGHSHDSDASPSAWRLRGTERASSLSAQKWRQLKASLKMLGQRKKQESTIDQAKSAELMAELLAGAPAALFLASMFQRDEHDHKKVPVLLEQLKIRITDSQRVSKDGKDEKDKSGGDRHLIFRIELEYGSGITRMKWIIHRTLRDFANLHLKYKVQEQTDRFKSIRPKESSKAELPRFPRSAFPYLRGVRGLFDDDEDEEEDEGFGEASGLDGEASGTDRPRTKRKPSRRPSFGIHRRTSSITSPQIPGLVGEIAVRTGSFAGAVAGPAPRNKENYAERQRKKLEQYLQQLISHFIFRVDSNRLCKFLEISALGVRLAAEGGYHGKEGVMMMIQSSKGLDLRRAWNPKLIANRHSPKWFLVRHSYVVCVDSIEEMNVFDVFLVDSDFEIEHQKKRLRDSKPQDIASKAKTSATHPKHHQLKLRNAERRVKLLAKNERQLLQFEESIKFMASQTEWAQDHRFGSFAPVRQHVFAQWLVDGRDYMWNVSRAISMARDVIYIHDWWLSPELYLRRPAAISQKWRLDRLLKRKAQEGVKVFVIMYRNINTAIPIDSEYSKFSLLDLHENVFVQRSPNQFRQNTFFWAHHEKICIIDHTVAFCGGVDLCFGRWDTPTHAVVDDKLTGFELNDMPKDADHCQLWPGKDYSNPRVQDFYSLDKPYEEMYDRTKVPRMPWHDIGMQVVGQPARDLSRHFVQRWNYVLRQRKPSRPTPFLLPPPDFNLADLEALGLDGTCRIQMLRSASAWSIGTPNKTENSIMQAYVKMIQQSEHFVYIENQFFISSCEVLGTRMENTIGDALVDRIKRAAENGEDWRAVIIIPLMPGFQNSVDSQDGSSVRLIMTCQYCSISRGETSIFSRLRAAGIEPEDYIQFYALRSWGKIGPNQALTTEQLYIHAKCMVVDDRIAIIGSANINERSMLGSRDSEVAAIVEDTEMLDSIMAGEPYKVGRFPHTLRMRLMREHIGIDVDELVEEVYDGEEFDDHYDSDGSDLSSQSTHGSTAQRLIDHKNQLQDEIIAKADMHTFNHDVDWEQAENPHLKTHKKTTADPRVINNERHAADVRGEGAAQMAAAERVGLARGRDSYLSEDGREVLVSSVAPEGRGTLDVPLPAGTKARKNRPRSGTTNTKASTASWHGPEGGNGSLPPPMPPRMNTQQLGLTQLSQLPPLPTTDDTDIGGPPLLKRQFSAASAKLIGSLIDGMRRPVVTPDCMIDPVNDSFFHDTWHQIAENNTKIFRQVFRCQPDNEVKTWKEYKEYMAFVERFNQAQGGGKSKSRVQQETPGQSGPPGTAKSSGHVPSVADVEKKVEGMSEKVVEKVETGTSRGSTSLGADNPSGNIAQWAEEQEKQDQAFHKRESRSTVLDEKDGSHLAADAESTVSGTWSHVSNAHSFQPPPIPDSSQTDAGYNEKAGPGTNGNIQRNRTVTISEPRKDGAAPGTAGGSQKRRRRATTRGSVRAFQANDDSMLSKEDAEELLKLVQGHLVVWPYDWLEKEESGGGWFYAVDQIAPLEI